MGVDWGQLGSIGVDRGRRGTMGSTYYDFEF